MLGAIAGDVIGFVYEHRPVRSTEFDLFSRFLRRARFTDATLLTVATAEVILYGQDYRETYRSWARRCPVARYVPGFRGWVRQENPSQLASRSNGSAIRVGPVGWAYDTPEEVLQEAQRSASVSHDGPEGIRGAQSVALAVYRARTGTSKEDIRQEIADRFGYDLARTIEEIRPTYRLGARADTTCEGSVPEAILAFLDATSWEHAVRLAVSLGGDSDAQACIAGAIAEAYYGPVPPEIASRVRYSLTPEMLTVLDAFQRAYLE